MEVIIRAEGTVEIDGATAGSWSVDDSATRGALTIAGVRHPCQISRPVGQGSRLQVASPDRPLLELSYDWRDGYRLTGHPSESGLEFEETRLADRMGTLASVSWTSRYVRIRFRDEVSLNDVARYATLIAMSRFFADRTGPFSRGRLTDP